MQDQFKRTSLLVGEEGINKLKCARVAVFGIGGVGGYVCEALARSGVGTFDLVDNDVVSESNINRQIIATHNTIGMPKVLAMKERILSINPDANVNIYQDFVLETNIDNFPFDTYDYVIDCVDTVSAKIAIVMHSLQKNVKVISSMGTGNKLDPTKLLITDIYKTSICPLAKVMRHEMKKRRVKHLDVLVSTEYPIKVTNVDKEDIPLGKHTIPGSTAFVPSAAGLVIASHVVRKLIGNN